MTLFATLKSNSKAALHNNWKKATGVVAIFGLVFLILSFLRQYSLDLFASIPYTATLINFLFYRAPLIEMVILTVSLLITIVFLMPLEFGLMNWFFSLVVGKSPSVIDMFSFFETAKKYLKTVWLLIYMYVRCVLWALLFMLLPAALMWISSNIVNGAYMLFPDNLKANAAFGSMGFTLSVFIMVFSCVCYLIFIKRYALCAYLYFEDGSIPITKAFKLSVQYTHGYRLNLFLYQLSFIGWAVACLLVIPAFFVIPYYFTSMSMYAKYLIESNNSEVNEYDPPQPVIEMADISEQLPTQEFIVNDRTAYGISEPQPDLESGRDWPHESEKIDT